VCTRLFIVALIAAALVVGLVALHLLVVL